MPRLSNFFRSRDPLLGRHPIHCRIVAKQEIEPALRLILTNDNGLAGDEAVLDFLSFAVQRKIDLNQIWIAEEQGTINWALLPITSPGRTMLIISPSRFLAQPSIDAAKQLVEEICIYWADQGMQMSQFLLDPQDTAICDLYSSCDFEILAELLYLQKTVHNPAKVDLPSGFELLNYSDATERLFAEAILRSYEASLDCPALNGRRSIEDVIAGHKAAGIFDPNLWYLLREGGESRGVLILSPSQHNESIELVYLGLTVEARHRGLGDALMRLALNSVVQQKRTELSLAVDSRNIPALRLYYRHGLQRIGSRIAMVRELKRKPTHPQNAYQS